MAATGYFSGTVDFGSGPIAGHALPWLDPLSDQDMFVVKYHANGSLWWARGVGSESTDRGYGVALAPNGDVVVTGTYQGYTDFGTGTPCPQSGADAFVARYAATTGALIWVRCFGDVSSDSGYAVSVDTNDNVVVAGWFRGTIHIGSGTLTSTAGDQDVFVAKLDGAGNTLWAKILGGAGSGYAYDVSTDAAGNVLVAGMFDGSLSVETTTHTSYGASDGYIAKFAGATGARVFSWQFGGPDADQARGIAVSADGSLLVLGTFGGTASFVGASLVSNGGRDIFVLKRSGANGSRIWEKRAGGTGDEDAGGIAADASGNAIVTGTFANVVDFGGGNLTANSRDTFLAKYNATGGYVSQHQYGANGMQYGAAVALQPGTARAVVAGYQGNTATTSVNFGNGPHALNGGTQWDALVAAVTP